MPGRPPGPRRARGFRRHQGAKGPARDDRRRVAESLADQVINASDRQRSAVDVLIRKLAR